MEIMFMENDIKVSVICIAYNHQKYIRKCLEGFVTQKTNFAFEVIVHDDASTDETANIIKEYAEKYPNIIKPILQTENQYSKHIQGGIIKNFILPKAKGKYVALCEGDDCWLDENKLQTQADYLDAHTDCFCVAHSFVQHKCKTGEDVLTVRSKVDRDFTLEEIVAGGGALFATNSLFVRKEVKSDMPECFVSQHFGDYQIPIFAAILGKVHYQNRVMSQYNVFTENSWSKKQKYSDEKAIMLVHENIRLLTAVNEFYQNKYNDSFENTIKKLKLEVCFYQKKYKEIKNDSFYQANKSMFSKAFRVKVVTGAFSPKFLNLIVNIKRKLVR